MAKKSTVKKPIAIPTKIPSMDKVFPKSKKKGCK